MKKLKTYFALKAGSITTKVEDGKLKFLIVHRLKWDDYTLPNGHARKDEALEDAAIRETLEETGYPIEVLDFIGSFEYKDWGDKKEYCTIRRVYYFSGKVVGEKIDTENPDGVEGKTIACWMSYDEALDKLSFDGQKDLIKEVFKKNGERVEI